MNYWKECISEACDDAGLLVTDEQINTIAEWVEGAHENYGMANGYDVIDTPSESMAKRELRELKAKIDQKEKWMLSTAPCTTCNTTGSVKDGWGRDRNCPNCDGKGRV